VQGQDRCAHAGSWRWPARLVDTRIAFTSRWHYLLSQVRQEMAMNAMPQMIELIGLPKQSAPLDVADRLEKGLPVSALDRLARTVAPADANFKYRIVPRATLARRRATGRLSPAESEKVARVARVFSYAKEVWKTDEETRDFLSRPNMYLRDRAGLDVAIGSEVGAQEVERVIGGIKYSIVL
jgi:putative toxin-antitoxin system antitoxin component (TIGR02293 family)